jgi:hypothetical protein
MHRVTRSLLSGFCKTNVAPRSNASCRVVKWLVSATMIAFFACFRAAHDRNSFPPSTSSQSIMMALISVDSSAFNALRVPVEISMSKPASASAFRKTTNEMASLLIKSAVDFTSLMVSVNTAEAEITKVIARYVRHLPVWPGARLAGNLRTTGGPGGSESRSFVTVCRSKGCCTSGAISESGSRTKRLSCMAECGIVNS